MPPSTCRVVPVTKAARGEARKTTTLANSSGRPRRPNGISAVQNRRSASANEIFSRSANVLVSDSSRSVAIGPGHTVFTRMFSGPGSVANVLANPTTARRTALDNTRLGSGCLTTYEAMLRMRPPPCLRMYGMTARVRRTVLIRLRLIPAHHCSSVISTNDPVGGLRALFTRISIRPNRFAAVLTNRSASSALLTSACTGSTSPPMSAAAASRASLRRAQMATWAPSSTNSFATAFPRPRLAAATSAVWPRRPRSIHPPSLNRGGCAMHPSAARGAWLLVFLVVLGVPGPSGRREAAQPLGQFAEAPSDQGIDRAVRALAVGVRLTRLQPGQDLQAFVDRTDCPDVELPLAHDVHHIRPQHQIGDILHRDHHALPPGQPERLAHRKVPLDLLVDAADRLNFPLLVDRPGDGDALLDRHGG